MKNYTIYKHTNNSNGKIYIGQTCQNVEQRFNNGMGYQGCQHFFNAIVRYGWINFSHEILYTGLKLEEANTIESLLIALSESQNPDIGYNIQGGGDNYNRELVVEKPKRSYSKMAKEDKELYSFRHKETGEIIKASIIDMANAFELHVGNLFMMAKHIPRYDYDTEVYRKSVQGWEMVA